MPIAFHSFPDSFFVTSHIRQISKPVPMMRSRIVRIEIQCALKIFFGAGKVPFISRRYIAERRVSFR